MKLISNLSLTQLAASVSQEHLIVKMRICLHAILTLANVSFPLNALCIKYEQNVKKLKV